MPAGRETRAFAPYEWLIAGRYLRPRRQHGFVSVIALFSFLGVMVGVAALIAVMAVMNGFREELYDKMLGINGHVIVNRVGEPFKDYVDVARRLAEVPGVETVMPLIEGPVLFSSRSYASGGYLRGMRAEDIKRLTMVSRNVPFGTFEGFDDSETIAIGTRLADLLGVNVGDTVSVINPKGKTTVLGVKPNIKAYKVSAIFEIGMSEYDRTIVFMPLREAQIFLNYPDQVNVLELQVEHPDRVNQITPLLKAAGGPGLFVTDWQKRNETFLTVLDVERNTMFLILSLIVVVAAFNIISGLIMLVKDKSRDIAILRTMGATSGSVMRVFLITGTSVGVLGTIAGFFVGLLIITYRESIRQFISLMTGTPIFDPKVYFLSELPARMDPYETTAVVVTALLLSVLATIYPSWRASRLDPVQALRYE